MSYRKGDLEIDVPDYDARDDNGYDSSYKFNDVKVAMLPHSCDSWIIGREEEIDALIEDLKEAKQKLTKKGTQ